MRIGIPVGIGEAQFNINKAYVNYVAGAGMEPILITPANNIQTMAELCNGLLLPGGIDIDPMYYGEDNYASANVDPEKDEFERRLFSMFGITMKKPVFGICRGFQLIAKEFLKRYPQYEEIMDYWQHIDSHSLASSLGAPRNSPTHFVIGSRKALYNEEEDGGEKYSKIPVNSMHHQALTIVIDKIKEAEYKKFRCIAWTQRGMPAKLKDRAVVEAFRLIGCFGGKVMGVQWHPEELKDYELIKTFFSGEAEKFKAA